MYQSKKIYVIVAAAGAGKRMGSNINKQYAMLCGIPVLARTLLAFQKHPAVDEIIIAMQAEEIKKCREEIIDRYGISKAAEIVPGGAERQDSVYQALSTIHEHDGCVLIHDGARPLITFEEIDEVIKLAAEHGAAAVGVPVKDTIKVSDQNGRIISTPDRNTLYAIRTPQAFQIKLIKEAFVKAYEEGFYGTDETVLLERMGEEVHISRGDYGNIKITTPEDLIVGEALLKTGRYGDFHNEDFQIPKADAEKEKMPQIRTGIGYDVHAFDDDRKLILGGVEIPHARGLLGHSDADVLVHAIMDALLGACGLGDIGRHFPDTDTRYKGISSLKLLAVVGEMLKKEGKRIFNVDAVVIAQKPKLSPYIDKMAENIANTLNIETGRVNVKATTTERLGFEGREEGISAQAVATIAEVN